MATGKDLYQIPTEGGHVASLTISPDSRMLLASAWGKSNPVTLWELSTRQIRKQIILPDGGAGPVAFSPDGKLFAVGTDEPDRRIRIFDAAKGEELDAIQGFAGYSRSLAFTADGRRLLSGMSDTTVLVWDLKLKR